MSIATRTGDAGSTGLMYNRRVPKTHLRVDASGAIDELNSALGLARGCSRHDFIWLNLFKIQKVLILLMGEVSTLAEDLPRYEKDGYERIAPTHTAHLGQLVADIESQNISFKGW